LLALPDPENLLVEVVESTAHVRNPVQGCALEVLLALPVERLG
jgi:hypothetical protein